MLDQPTQLSFVDDDTGTSEATFRLGQLEVYNWGPFAGFHRADFDPQGTAIIGPTGSGKTTLVDALMTLLVLQPRYNLASTGGHESDRTLISYVRGVLGGDGSNGNEEIARPGKTITGISATYHSRAETLRLAGLLWIDGPSNAAEDLKRRWFFSQAGDQSLEQWLRQLHDDGIRDLMRLGRETADLRIFDSKTSYLAHVRKFFDVGENAFTLLNRAAGLKQLNSIDEIFRDLVLDDRSAFERAIEVAGEFDNLTGIHNELEIARRQQESLVPIAQEQQQLLKARSQVDRSHMLKRIVPVWFAITRQLRWAEAIARIAAEHQQLRDSIRSKQDEEKECRARVDTLRERYLQLGGNAIGELEKVIELQNQNLADRTKHANDYRRMVTAFRLNDEISADALLCNQALLTEKRGEIAEQNTQVHEKALDAVSRHREQQAKQDDTAAALKKVKERPGSNIPPRFQDFRAELAAQLTVTERDLPFLAELVEVAPDQSAWRGAIERAIGSERLRILVPEAVLDNALRWVNHRDNRLHVRLQKARGNEPQATFFSDSYLLKLNIRSHSLEGTARRLLATRDLHCVSSPEALKKVEHGLTIQGMISGQHGRFEKQDQKRLHEDWMTGFDNKDQLEALRAQLVLIDQSAAHWKSESQRFSEALRQLDEQLKMIESIIELRFSMIDQPGAESDLIHSRQRLAELLDPQSDACQAKEAYEIENQKLDSLRESIGELEKKVAILEAHSTRAEQEHDKAYARIGSGLTDEEKSLAEKHLAITPNLPAEDLGDAERDMSRDIDEKLGTHLERVASLEKRLVHLMDGAKQVDTGALADIGSDIEDIPHYVDRLRVLNEEALPEKRSRFLDYLNRSSDQGVTQLLAGIDEEVDAIEQRIKELNQTLVKVDFRSGRYLQLQPQRIKHERLRSLETAMRKVRSAALKDDEGESHYKSLRELVEILREAAENRRQLGSRALLDPRYRLQFFVVETDRQTGGRSPPRSGSQSGSGGEKELMASHILTASLSYALCPSGASQPLYGTVILDEAFSKSSPSAASRIIEALRIFCLHPIFVTPNKEIGLLRQHTRSVICVQRPTKQASLASITWEKLDELARKL
jgi:uncharacterized protein YPO0396